VCACVMGSVGCWCSVWLGHVARMEDDRLPKQLLFGELLTVRPCHRPKLCWRDVIVKDVQRMGLDPLNWYEVAQNRPRWYELCQTISSGEFPEVPLWSLVLLCVAVGGPLVALVI